MCFRHLLACLAFVVGPVGSLAEAATLSHKDQRRFVGRVGELAAVAEDPNQPQQPAEGGRITPIVVVDTGLRRIFFPQVLLGEVNSAALKPQVKITVPQKVARGGRGLGAVGQILSVDPFDEWGRRILTMQTLQGPLDVVQGITQITPTFTVVNGLLVAHDRKEAASSVTWEMRMATSSIPRETLSRIMHGVIDADDSNERLQIVRFYIESERYLDARRELQSVLQEFPELSELDRELTALDQQQARALLREIERRSAAGQHQTVRSLLQQFPAEGVAGETLERVRAFQRQYEQSDRRITEHRTRMQGYLDALGDPLTREQVRPLWEEIKVELSHETLPRLNALLNLADDPQLTADDKLALGLSGWLVGSDHAVPELGLALSLRKTRQLVHDYLRTENRDAAGRQRLLAALREEEAATAARVSQLLQLMLPPLADALPEPTGPDQFTLRVDGLAGEAEVTYLVQLPPEYTPRRRYPVVVTLAGVETPLERQVDWWAGAPNSDGVRLGQAGRHGYIVIAVEWRKPFQQVYEFSARAHHAVLASLRDAVRRFSIDTDRVFLSGHSAGAAAAWDIGVAHPDLWAGVIPIAGRTGRYISRYWPNAKHLATYFVGGEMDGDQMVHNAIDFDRYLRKGFDCTVVEYLGRGHEHFYDEILQLFDWMNRKRRDFFPEAIDVRSMRPWDNYFWWVELADLPEQQLVDPADWPPPRGKRTGEHRASRKGQNISVARTAAGGITVWLSPQMVDFEQRIRVTIKGREQREPIRPQLEVLLEDVRTRHDRQHPFWARVDL